MLCIRIILYTIILGLVQFVVMPVFSLIYDYQQYMQNHFKIVHAIKTDFRRKEEENTETLE